MATDCVFAAQYRARTCYGARLMHAPGPATIPVETLLMAYRQGVFPMADGRDDPEVFWVEPRQRAIIPLATFRPSHSLLKLLRQDRFRVTLDADFDGVIAACAAPSKSASRDRK